jgi:hypothetical protein
LRRALFAVTLGLGLGLSAPTSEADGPLHDGLLANDPLDAWKAIEQAMASKDKANAIDLVQAGLATKWPHVAVGCGDALALLPHEVVEYPDVREVIDKALNSKKPDTLRNLARVLAAWGDPSFDEELAWLASGRRSAEVQAEALQSVGGLKVTPDTPWTKVIGSVAGSLRSKSPVVVLSACSAAGRLKDASFEPVLSELSRTSQEEYVALYAVWALRTMGKRIGIKGYAHVLTGSPKPHTAAGSLKGITDLSTADDVELLITLTRAVKKDHREAACIALGLLAEKPKGGGGLGGPVVTPGEGTPPSTPPPDSGPPSKLVERLLQIVETDPDWEVRDAAARALWRIGEPARGGVLRDMPLLVDASDRDIALAATELCMFFKAADATKALMKVSIYDKDRARRMAAARALSDIAPDAAVDEWMAGIKKDRKGRDTTLNMVRAIGYVRSEKAYEALVSFFGEETWSEEILREVERSLDRLTGHRFGRRQDRWSAWYAKAKTKHPFHPHLGRYDRSKSRREAQTKKLYGLTDVTERSLEGGLRWLELQQHEVGWWDGNEKGFGGTIGCEPAYTGLSLLAYLGAGYRSSSGKYRETTRRAAEFLVATQLYDGGYPVSGGGDNSWIFAYLIGMGVWGMTESFAMTDDDRYKDPAQRGIDYLVRVQTPGAGWRYGPRYAQTDTSCTSWVLMTMKSGAMVGLNVPPRAYDGIDSWLERCSFDVTGESELPEDMMTDYDREVGGKRHFKAFTGYFELSGSEASSLQQTSMTAVGMVCRFFMGWQRSHPYEIGCANYLMDYLPQWRKGLERGQAIAWYFYFYYYGTLAMHQMGGPFWRQWNERIKNVLPPNQKKNPEELEGSWDPDTAVLNGGRLFSTAMACLTLETYYRFSPLMLSTEEDEASAKKKARAGNDGAPPAPAMDGK